MSEDANRRSGRDPGSSTPVDDQPESGGPERPEIIARTELLAGVWANVARVAAGDHEFTIDFIRMDPFAPRGILGARVSGSARFIMELIDNLRRDWDAWAKERMPPESRGGDDGRLGDEDRGGE